MSSGANIANPSARSRPYIFYLIVLVCVTAAVRAMWMIALPAGALSQDIKDWDLAVQGMTTGFNPYAKSPIMNWPPFWMEMLYVAKRASVYFGISLYSCIRLILIGADLLVLVATMGLLRTLDVRGSFFLLLLVGYALNPQLTLLTIQHANFDAFAAFWIVLFLIFLIQFRRRGEAIDWLLAAGCLGIGGFTKTFPILLWPLLAPGFFRLSWSSRWLGIGLLAGPIVLSLAPLYVLSPDKVTELVLRYHSMGADFGVLGLLHIGGADTAGYVFYSPKILLAGLAVLAMGLSFRDLERDEDVVLLAGMILLGLFTLGSGYGPQYWFWVTPLLLVCFRGSAGVFRIVLLVCGIVVVGGNIVEYAVVPWLGMFLFWMSPGERLMRFGDKMYEKGPQMALLQLPVTLAAIIILLAGIAVLWRAPTCKALAKKAQSRG